MLTDEERTTLEILCGHMSARAFLNRPESASLMRRGLAEVVAPPQTPGRAKPIDYATITPAGRAALEEE